MLASENLLTDLTRKFREQIEEIAATMEEGGKEIQGFVAVDPESVLVIAQASAIMTKLGADIYKAQEIRDEIRKAMKWLEE